MVCWATLMSKRMAECPVSMRIEVVHPINQGRAHGYQAVIETRNGILPHALFPIAGDNAEWVIRCRQ